MLRNLLFIIAIAMGTSALAQTTYYVKSDGNDNLNGLTWNTAFESLQKALDMATFGDAIWVAQGTYYPSAPPGNVHPDDIPGLTDRDFTFILVDGVNLYGGFAGNETSIDDRSPGHTTILSGDIGIPGDASDNVYHVVLAHHIDRETHMNGFTVRDGNADQNTSIRFEIGSQAMARDAGAGLFIQASSAFNLENMIVQANVSSRDGAGIMMRSSNLKASDLKVMFNHSDAHGGGISAGRSELVITKTIILDNTANGYGGGLNLSRSNISMHHALVTGNTGQNGGAIHISGLMDTTGTYTCNLYNSTIAGNVATNAEGMLLNPNAGMTLELNVVHSVLWNSDNDFVGLDSPGLLNIKGSNAFTSQDPSAYGSPEGFIKLDSNPFIDSDNASGADGQIATPDDGFIPKAGSVLLDVVNTKSTVDERDTDITGIRRRHIGEATDVGAYEHCPDPLATEIRYFDGDGDGYGDSDISSSFNICDVSEDHVLQVGDCDDADASVYPGALEICDNKDNDCNGTIDDNDYPFSVIYVRANATGDNSGTDWNNAFTSLQDALDKAARLQSCVDEIWVAEGTYYPSGLPRNADPLTSLGDRDFTFHLVPGVKMYGGFAGHESRVVAREGGETVLSGDIGVPNLDTDNCYHVVTLLDAQESTLINGFTVKDGYGSFEAFDNFLTVDGTDISRRRGAGVVLYNSNAVLEALVIQTNNSWSGGGLFINGSAPNIRKCVIVNNTSSADGGGIALGISSARFYNTLITANTATGRGSGIFVDRGRPSFYNVTITNHVGYGLYSNNEANHLKLYNTLFYNNRSSFGSDQDLYFVHAPAVFNGNSNFSAQDPTTFGGDTAGFSQLLDNPFVNIDDPEGPDGTYRTSDDGLAIGEDSGLLDIGFDDPSVFEQETTDITGVVRRMVSGIPDIGAYESCTAVDDTDGDGIVDCSDACIDVDDDGICDAMDTDNTQPNIKIFLLAGGTNMLGHAPNTELDRLLCANGSLLLDDDPDGCYLSDTDLKDRYFNVISDFYYNDTRGTFENGYEEDQAREEAKRLFANPLIDGQLKTDHGRVSVVQFQYERNEEGFRNLVPLEAGALNTGFGKSATTYGPELMLGRYLSEYFDGEIILVKVIEEDSNLYQHWRADGGDHGDGAGNFPLLKAHLEDVRDTPGNYLAKYAGRSTMAQVEGIFWFQGWQDALNAEYANNYEQNLSDLIGTLRDDLGQPNLPAVIINTHNDSSLGEVVQKAQTSVANSIGTAAALVTTDLSNYEYFDAASPLLIGQSAAVAMRKLIEGYEIATPVLHMPRLTGDQDHSSYMNVITVTTGSDYDSIRHPYTGLRGKTIDMALEVPFPEGSSTVTFKFIPDNLAQNDTIGAVSRALSSADFLTIVQKYDALQLLDKDGTELIEIEGLSDVSCNHLGIVMRRGEIDVYLNGSWYNEIALPWYANNHMVLGPYNGQAWDLRIWDRAVSPLILEDLSQYCLTSLEVDDPPYGEEYNNPLCGAYVCLWGQKDEHDMTEEKFQYYLDRQELAFETFVLNTGMYPMDDLDAFVYGPNGRRRDYVMLRRRDHKMEEGIVNTFVRSWSLSNPHTRENVNYWLHENFHSYQLFKRLEDRNAGPGQWLMESTAEWAPNAIFPGAHSTLLGHYSLFPHLPLWTVSTSPVEAYYGTEFAGGHAYGSYAFFNYLTQVTSTNLIGKLFNRWPHDHMKGLRDLLEEEGYDLKEVFADFAARTTVWDYDDGTGPYFKASEEDSRKRMKKARPWAQSFGNKITDSLSAKGTEGYWRAVPDKLKPGAWAYNAFKIDSTLSTRYTLKFRGAPENPVQTGFKARAVIKSGDSYSYMPFEISEEASQGRAESSVDIWTNEGDALYLVVASTPDIYEGFEYIYDYQYAIEVACSDCDGDGHTEIEGDCDDTDAEVHPDAEELAYNGKDDDCDAATPDDDLDGDGYLVEEDCDDTDPAIHPGATELCDDGIDNDCNGLTDGDEATWYRDEDNDGYGNPAVSVLASDCVRPDGYVLDSTDCDDSDAAINPGAEEACNDGVDDNCDGEGEPCEVCAEIGPEFDCNNNGVPDECELTTDSLLDRNVNGVMDVCEIMADVGLDCNGNGILDAWELENPEHEDTDPMEDTDGDDVPNGCDNCPNDVNTDQADADDDGIGDVCDPCVDVDGDGICNDMDCDDYDTMVSRPDIGLDVVPSPSKCGDRSIYVLYSEIGVTYQLLSEDGSVLDEKPGNGGAATFTVNPEATTNYMIGAYYTADSGCSVILDNGATIRTIPDRTLRVVSEDDDQDYTLCEGSSTQIVVQASETEVFYELYANGTATGIGSRYGNDDPVVFNVTPDEDTEYTVKASYSLCGSVFLNDKVRVTVEVFPNTALTVEGSEICPGDPGTVKVLDSQEGITYQLVLASDDSPIGDAQIGDGGQLEFTVNPTETTTYVIAASSSSECGSLLDDTATVRLKTDVECEPLSLIDPNRKWFLVFPNPASGIFYIKTMGAYQIDKVEIYDTNNKLVKRVTQNFNEIGIRDLASAMYLVRIHTNQGISSHRLIID
ncbi:MopE-related protein [Aestuariivivens sediminicola]|uniref:MopE-related protein n=1 Tax=Aestuariivivens sediminicola TaxID=2913560 RepID=UPI001F58B02F|nr:MopE-related protein [Aestuariivivens sediminicola]